MTKAEVKAITGVEPRCNFYSVYDLDSEKPMNYTWIDSDIERIYSKYPLNNP